MAAVTMLDRLIEASLAEMLSSSVTGTTYHLSHDTSEKKHPYLMIRAVIGDETPVRLSGVFNVTAQIFMAERADDTTADAFAAKSARMLQAFYNSDATVTRLNATTAIGSAKVIRCDIQACESGVDSEERAYTRTLDLGMIAYPNTIAG